MSAAADSLRRRRLSLRRAYPSAITGLLEDALSFGCLGAEADLQGA